MIFLVRSPLTVVCKLVCFPFAACLPWSASVRESMVEQLELHLGPFWSCCTLEAPARAQAGDSRGWVSLGQPPHTAAPAQGSRPWGLVSVPGDLFWEIPVVSRMGAGLEPQAVSELPALGPCGGSLPEGSCFQKCIWYSWRVSDAKATPRGRIWDMATEALQHPSPHGNCQGVFRGARADPPRGALKVTAVFYLLLTCLANNGYGALAFYLITMVSNVTILESTLMLGRLALFFLFLNKALF